MRSYTLALLSRLNKDGKTMEDKDIVDWVNEKVLLFFIQWTPSSKTHTFKYRCHVSVFGRCPS